MTRPTLSHLTTNTTKHLKQDPFPLPVKEISQNCSCLQIANPAILLGGNQQQAVKSLQERDEACIYRPFTVLPHWMATLRLTSHCLMPYLEYGWNFNAVNAFYQNTCIPLFPSNRTQNG